MQRYEWRVVVTDAFGVVRIPGRSVAVAPRARRSPPLLTVGAAVGVAVTTAAPIRTTGGWSAAATDLCASSRSRTRERRC
jgi:hypothetical protein